MALRFVDGFDHYNTITQKWISAGPVTFTSSGTRFSTGSCITPTSANATVKGFDNQATWVAGVAVKWPGAPTSVALLGFRDSGVLQMEVRPTTSSAFQVTRNGTVLATTANGIFSQNVWYYLEFKVTINNSTGSYELRMDGVTLLSATGVDTQNTANAYANELAIVGSGGSSFDDLYLCDGTGAANNSFLGDVRVDTIFPTADTATSDFTPSTGTDNYAMVDDATPDSDSTYVASGTTGHMDLYTFGDLQSLTGSVFGVQSVIFGRKDDAGTRSVAPLIKTGATTAVGADFTLAASYAYNLQIFETNPANSSTAWSISDVNNSEFGIKVTA